MQKENFKNLLTDLYNIYNPANLQYVDDLVDRYSRMEADAVKNIFIKYNRKTAPHYDESLGTDEYIINIIKEYEAGSRVFQSLDIKANAIQKNQTQESQKVVEKESNVEEIKQISEEVKGEVSDKIKGIEVFFEEKERQLKQFFEEQTNSIKKLTTDEVDYMNKRIEELIKTPSIPEPIIRIFSTHTSTELNLPNKKYLANLGIGARIIAFDDEKKVIGLEISDITIDYISDVEGAPIIEITVNKA